MKMHRGKKRSWCTRYIFLPLIFLLQPAYKASGNGIDTLSVAYLIHQADSLFDNFPSFTERYAKQALSIAITKGDEPGQFAAYYQLVRASFRLGRTEEALERARIAEAGFLRLKDKHSLASLYHTWANGLYLAGKMEESQIYSDKSIALAIESGNFFALGLQYYTRATKARRTNETYLAIEYLDKALEVKGSGRKLERIKTRANTAMGGIYASMGEYEKALDYTLKAGAKFAEFGMYREAGTDYASAGHYYTILSKYDSAYICLRKSMELFGKTGPEYIKYAKIPVWHQLAQYFEKLKQPDSAFYYIHKAIDTGEEYNQQTSIPHYYNTAARLYYHAGNYDKAMHYAKKTMELSQDQNILEYIRESEKLQADIYYHTGKPDSAATYYRRYLTGDTLQSLTKSRREIMRLSELRMQEQTAFQREQETMKRRILTISLAACLAVISIMVFLLQKIGKQRNKITSINADLTEHKEELKQLLDLKSAMLDDKERQYASLCNNMLESAVFRAVFDDRTNIASGRMEFISSGWEEMSGKPWEPCKFMECLAPGNLFPDDREMLRNATQYALTGESPLLNITFRYAKSNAAAGEYIWLRMKAAVVATAAGTMNVDGFLIDVTDRIQYEEKLIAAKNKAEESDRLKTAFFNNISHEIRTPLNAILGFAQLFDDPDISPEQRTIMSGIIKTSAAELTRMIEDIITLSEIDSNILAVMPNERHHIPELLDRVAADAKNIAKAAGKSKLEIIIDNQLPETVETITLDGQKIIRILTHLMDNAIKHTDYGYIILGCEALPHEQAIMFRVEDTGAGINAADIEKVFVRFWKKRDHAREHRGLGIGLPLCRELLKLMHGEIAVESTPEAGTTFSFKVTYGN